MSKHSRRDALKYLGASAAYTCASARASAPRIPDAAVGATREPEYFRLRDVRLTAGPFLDAQKLDEAYLLRLEPDRMLANFRKNAGLPARAPVYGGWESVEPWVWIRCHGHTLGHYLTAAACMYESTGDPRFAERVDYIVGELAACQSKTGGWLTAFPDGAGPLTDSVAGKEFAGVPWYTTHKVLAGLRDAHAHRGNATALDVWRKFTDWIDDLTRDVPQPAFQKMLDREHGGMNEVCADLFALTGDPRHLALANRFSHLALLLPLSRGEDALDGLHANTQIPKVIGFSRIAQLPGANPQMEQAASHFWQTVVRRRSFATGGHGDGEHFFPNTEFAKHLGSGKTMETCCTHNMLRLTRSLYARDARAEYFDFFERALFNGILASQDPDTGMNTYFQSTRPGYVRLYHTPFDSFWCCTGSGLENHARYGESIYAHADDALYVNLFIASTLDWHERGIRVTQRTRFPDVDHTRIELESSKKQAVKIRIREPAWCAGMTVEVNGRRLKALRRAGGHVEVDLNTGDALEVRLPMSLRVEPLPNDDTHAALVYGPIVLAGRFGTEGLTAGSQLIINERESGDMLQAAVQIPRWTRPLDQLVANTTRTNQERLEFRTSGFEGNASVSLVPWFRLTHERYNLYWQRQV